jgi:Ca2+-binding EF-hand superfamily protein
MMKKLVLVAAVAALAVPAFAQTPPTPAEREARFTAADANHDGKLDKAEFTNSIPEDRRGMVDQIWGRIDADGDGFVTKEQFLAMRGRGGPPPGGGGN